MDLLSTVRTRLRDLLCRLRWELGQTTAEYALVLLAAAAVAFVLITWAKDNQALKGFFDGVVENLKEKANSAAD